jgi:hypothetical protein
MVGAKLFPTGRKVTWRVGVQSTEGG